MWRLLYHKILVYAILLCFATFALAVSIPIAQNLTVPPSNLIHCDSTRLFSPFYITLKTCARTYLPALISRWPNSKSYGENTSETNSRYPYHYFLHALLRNQHALIPNLSLQKPSPSFLAAPHQDSSILSAPVHPKTPSPFQWTKSPPAAESQSG